MSSSESNEEDHNVDEIINGWRDKNRTYSKKYRDKFQEYSFFISTSKDSILNNQSLTQINISSFVNSKEMISTNQQNSNESMNLDNDICLNNEIAQQDYEQNSNGSMLNCNSDSSGKKS